MYKVIYFFIEISRELVTFTIKCLNCLCFRRLMLVAQFKHWREVQTPVLEYFMLYPTNSECPAKVRTAEQFDKLIHCYGTIARFKILQSH